VGENSGICGGATRWVGKGTGGLGDGGYTVTNGIKHKVPFFDQKKNNWKKGFPSGNQ